MKKTQGHKQTETILVLVLALVILYWYYKKPSLLLMAGIIGLTGLFIPPAANGIHWLWMKLGEGIGFVMNKIILVVVFILIVVPLGWISRKAGKSSIRLKAGDTSYFKTRNHDFVKEDLENPW
ncbi:MAG: SxtJ family membrane protein [Bacteroidota bacterium]